MTRSSLLVEAGRQAEGTGTVPFYQFRHLTFQEYLAAVAAVEGHYQEYDKADTVLTPLQTYLSAEEWKEVIPMSAVLARKQAEPLMLALVESGTACAGRQRLTRTLLEKQNGWGLQRNYPPLSRRWRTVSPRRRKRHQRPSLRPCS